MLKHMTLAEMTLCSAQMVEKTARREVFLSIPEIAPLHRQLLTAHDGIIAAQPADAAPSPTLLAILAQEAQVDVRHDRLARACTSSLDAEREHSFAASEPDEGRAAMCDRVKTQLFPDGLSFITTSYAAEAGTTARAARLLEEQPEIGKFLRSIQVPGKKPASKGNPGGKATLLDTVQAWIDSGRELQKLEEQREAQVAKDAVAPSAKSILAARATWIRVISAVLANLDISMAPAEAVEAIRGPILAASERAEKRYAGSAASPETATPEAPKATTGATPPA